MPRFQGARVHRWGLGLFLAAYPFFKLTTVRIPGVLARIAWCDIAAALLTLVIGGRRRRGQEMD